MIPQNQLTNQPADREVNQKWQQLADNIQTSWNAGDPEQAKDLFNELYEISFPLLLTIARANAPAEMVEDVVAEAYLEFYELLVAQAPIRNAKALLRLIVRRRSIDEHRRHQKIVKHTQMVDEAMGSDILEIPDVMAETPEEIIVAQGTAHFISNLILDALTDEERRILIMRYVQELSVAETAVQLNLTVDQVKKRTQRASKLAYRVAQERGLLHDLS